MEFELEVEMDMDSSSSVADHDKLCTSDNIINIDQKHHEAEEEEEEEEEEKHNIFHVLAVDDSNIDRKLLHKLLTVSSYQVTCVDSGDKALEYLGLLEYETSSSSSTTLSHLTSSKSQPEASKVNLIMTDYSMPGISGYDLLKRIKDSTWKDVPVVVMSSENVPSRINMCLEGGAEEFILKPVKLSDLSKLQSHILKNTINTTQHDPNPQDDHQVTPKTDDVSAITSNEGKIVTTMNDINRDDNGSDKNCCNANKRKAMLTTPSDLSDRRAFVQELPVS